MQGCATPLNADPLNSQDMIRPASALGLCVAILASACAGSSERRELTDAQKAWRAERALEIEHCESNGGYVDRRGMFGTPVCAIPYADSGNPCQDGSDCEGRCVLDLNQHWNVEPPARGEHALGQCEPDNKFTGCYALIVGGAAEQAACFD